MPNLFIYGGCVSRDTKGIFPEDWTLKTYIARQSVVSAASGPVNLPGESRLSSKFQQRMVDNDIAGNALDIISETLEYHDLFLFDLIIDRRGVFEVSPGKYVSRSDEMIHSHLLDQQPTKARWVDFGTDEHFLVWRQSMQLLLDIIQINDVTALCIAPEWAEYDNHGQKITYQNFPVGEWNKKYKRYIDFISESGLKVIDVPKHLSVGDVNHQWGLTPFHFIPETYESLRAQILSYYEKTSSYK